MTECNSEDTRTSYDRIADVYVRHVYDELRHKPLDRELLDRFAAEVKDAGPVCDLGCGPGQIARYLHDRGLEASGLDLAPDMIEQARRLNAGMVFQVGDLRSAPFADGTLAGVVAFYSIIHVPRAQVVDALREVARVLRPGGRLLLAFTWAARCGGWRSCGASRCAWTSCSSKRRRCAATWRRPASRSPRAWSARPTPT